MKLNQQEAALKALENLRVIQAVTETLEMSFNDNNETGMFGIMSDLNKSIKSLDRYLKGVAESQQYFEVEEFAELGLFHWRIE